MSNSRRFIKDQIIAALRHPEAEEGLYFRNLMHLHEEDERPAVEGEEKEVLVALNELVKEGKVLLDQTQEDLIFQLAPMAA